MPLKLSLLWGLFMLISAIRSLWGKHSSADITKRQIYRETAKQNRHTASPTMLTRFCTGYLSSCLTATFK